MSHTAHSPFHLTRLLPVVIEISKRMSYIFCSRNDLGLGSSGVSLQTSLLRADVTSSMIDNGGCLAKGLLVIPCVIEIVLGFGRAGTARNELNFRVR
jgi:hypothetical protein